MRRGRGMESIMISELMLKTALVIRWCMAAEHCSKHCQLAHLSQGNSIPLATGTAQYWGNGLHQTPKYKVSIIIQLMTTYTPTIFTAICCLRPKVNLLYNNNRHILHPHIVVIMDCSTTKTSFDPWILDLIEAGVSRGMSLGNMRFVSRCATMFIQTMRLV